MDPTPEISTHILRDKVVITVSTKLSSKDDIKVIKHPTHILIYVPITEGQ